MRRAGKNAGPFQFSNSSIRKQGLIMEIKLTSYEKDNVVNFSVGKRECYAFLGGYDMTEGSKAKLEMIFFPYQVDHIAKALKEMIKGLSVWQTFFSLDEEVQSFKLKVISSLPFGKMSLCDRWDGFTTTTK